MFEEISLLVEGMRENLRQDFTELEFNVHFTNIKFAKV